MQIHDVAKVEMGTIQQGDSHEYTKQIIITDEDGKQTKILLHAKKESNLWDNII